MSLQNSHQISEIKVLLKKGADGAGIADIELTGQSLNVDTYTITLTNGDKYTFTVTNGSSIASIEKTGTSGNVDTYTITLTNGDTYTFTVTNAIGSSADGITYDNNESGLTATNVQDAIDEIVTIITTLATSKADKTDLASIKITGSTNTTGSTIKSGTFFYLNGTLVMAILDVASGATFTLNTNYEVISAGALNEIYSKLKEHVGELLYENSNSTTSLNTGTLPLTKAISNFSRVEIDFRVHTTVQGEAKFSSNVSNNTAVFKQAQMWLDGVHWYIFGRTISISGDTLTYDNGKSCYDGGTPSVDAGAFIIERVYGIA